MSEDQAGQEAVDRVNEIEAAYQKLVREVIPGKRYLGDGVYVESAGWGMSVVLTTTNGQEPTNRIVLEPDVLRALTGFVAELRVGVEQLCVAQGRLTAKDDPS